jgi:hypothetical protein
VNQSLFYKALIAKADKRFAAHLKTMKEPWRWDARWEK